MPIAVLKPKPQRVQASFWVDPDLWRRIRIAAISDGISASGLVERLLRQELATREEHR
jgi:hypothetical protein